MSMKTIKRIRTIKRIKRFPQVLENGHKYFRWVDLTFQEKKNNQKMFQILVDYCRTHIGKEVTFKQMDDTGLTHLYSFMVSDYNKYCPDYPLIITENGVHCEEHIERKITRYLDEKKRQLGIEEE